MDVGRDELFRQVILTIRKGEEDYCRTATGQDTDVRPSLYDVGSFTIFRRCCNENPHHIYEVDGNHVNTLLRIEWTNPFNGLGVA